MDCATYRHLFGQITNSCLTYHHNFPSHNLLSPETLLNVSKDLNTDDPGDKNKFLSTFPCYKQFPYGVRASFPLFCGSGATDYAKELVDKKTNWEVKLRKLRVSNVKDAVRKVRELSEKKGVKIKDGLRKYIEHFYNDPEPMFSGNYNWLYTGGCLSSDNSFDETILISADYVNKKPGFCVLQLNQTLDEVQYKSFYQLKNYAPVLQITCKSKQENVIICVRQKNYLSLFNAKRQNHLFDPVKMWRKKVLNSKLLTCVDLKDDCEEVILTDTNLDLHVFDVERKNKIYSCGGKKIAPDGDRSRWSQVAFGDRGVYWALKNCFAVLDLRDLYPRPKFEYNPAMVGEQCDEICSFVPSSCDSNFVYLSTTHSLLQLDLRNGKTVQKWTHMMKKSPQFITSIKDEESDFLVLQSHTVGETSGIVNECLREGEEVDFVSRSLPCLLMSVADSLNYVQLNGVCLNPLLGSRVNFAVTGMQCLKNDRGEIVLFTKNSGGDVFLSRIRKNASNGLESQQEVVERMKVYESSVESIPPKGATHPYIEEADMRHLLRREGQARTVKRPGNWWRREEMFSLESLSGCRDVLAGKILKVWGHRFEDVEEEDMSVDDKVREWMEKC